MSSVLTVLERTTYNRTMKSSAAQFTALVGTSRLARALAAIVVWFTFYNFCRVHKSLLVTPALESGIADHVWSVRELLN